MSKERVKCPVCGENITSVQIEGANVLVRSGGEQISFRTGEVWHHRCGARISFVVGQLAEYSVPVKQPVQMERDRV